MKNGKNNEIKQNLNILNNFEKEEKKIYLSKQKQNIFIKRIIFFKLIDIENF